MDLPSTSSTRCVRVLVADSSQTVAQVLCRALRQQPGMTVTSCRNELSHCLESLQAATADVVLLSDGLSNHDHVIQMLRGLHANYPYLRIIVLLDSYDRDFVVSAMCTGASGLFCRTSEPFRALRRCISVVHHGEFWLNTEQVTYVIDALRLGLSSRVINVKGENLLTVREEQVTSRILEGIPNREIAHQMGIKENTVKKTLLRIYDKLGISNRVELVLYVVTHRQLGSAPASPKRPSVPVPVTLFRADHVERDDNRAGDHYAQK